jgi:2-dehydropantoate 2-reductase
VKTGALVLFFHDTDSGDRNSAWSSMCAISRESFASICAPGAIELTVPVVRRTMLESLYVARALGYDETMLPASSVDEGIKVTCIG